MQIWREGNKSRDAPAAWYPCWNWANTFERSRSGDSELEVQRFIGSSDVPKD